MLGEMGIALQRSLKQAAACRGVGLHGGCAITMVLRPAEANSGIVFHRLDAGADIRARWDHTADCTLSTSLSNHEGVQVRTVEHLMAAFAGAGIDNAIVELDGAEVPIMDGSAAPFLDMIRRAGTSTQDAARRAIRILKPVRVSSGSASAELLPDHGFSMSFEIDFDNPLIRRQDMQLSFDGETFETELSRARTFGLLDDVLRLQAAGFALGGSLENAVVVSGDKVLNDGGLRYADEFVRHKLLDAVGDLYLAGGPIIGQFRGIRSGHALTADLLATLFADKTAWCEATIAEPGAIAPFAWSETRRRVSA